MSGLRPDEKLLFRIVWNSSDSVNWLRAPIRLHRAHISVFVFLGILNRVPIFILTILLATLSSWSHWEEKLTVSIATLHQLVLWSAIDE